MLKQIDRDLSYDYEFYLCRRDDREIIAMLKDGYNAYSFVYSPEFRNIDQLDFEIPFYVRDKDFKLVKNPVWDKVKADMVVQMIVKVGDEELFQEHFTIDTPKKIGGSEKKKVIHCFGYEQVLSNLRIRNFQGTRQLYLKPTETVETGQGILNLLEDKSYGDWKVGYIDEKVMNETVKGINARKYRTFAVSDKSWLDFIRTEIEPTFECVCEFSYDYNQKCNIINIYHIDNYGEDNGLYISEKNYIDTLTEEMNTNEMVTRLTIRGKENLTINSVNLGRGYLDDFSYYRNLDYMSQDLLNAFNSYDKLIESKTPVFSNYLTNLNNLTAQLSDKAIEMSTLNSEMSILNDNKDIAISNGLSQVAINQQIKNKQSQINSKQAEIDGIKNQIEAITSNINTLNNEVKLENNFSNEQLRVINRYLREATWSNENYFEVGSLLEAGKKAQKKMNEPQLNLELEIADFLDVVECQYDWKKLKIGNIVNAEYTLWDTFFQLRIIGYVHDISNMTLKISLSNRDFRNDAERYISNLSREVGNTSSTVNSNKDIWNTAQENGAWVAEFISNGLDAAKYKVTAGKNQKISIDERGVELASFDDAGIIRMLNNIIALSEDGEEYDLAITPQGIIAKKLIGELLVGQKLIINNEDGTVQVLGDGIIVKTPQGQQKVKLGKLDSGNYGISIFNSKGDVILSEQGIAQTNNIPFADNFDADNPLRFRFFIDTEVLSVRNARLSFTLEKYRAYSKDTKAGGSYSRGGETSTSELPTDKTNLAVYSSEDIAISDMPGHHYHYTTLVTTSHKHDVTIPSISISAHVHPQEYGIVETTLPKDVKINIYKDDVLVNSGTTIYNSNQTGIELKDYIQSSGLYTIEMTTVQNGRINLNLFLKYFISM